MLKLNLRLWRQPQNSLRRVVVVVVKAEIPSGYSSHLIVDVYPNRRLKILPKLLGSEFYPTSEEELVKAQEAEVFGSKGDGEPKKPELYMIYMNYSSDTFNKPPARFEDYIISVDWETNTEDCDHKGKIVFYNNKKVRDSVKMYSEVRIYFQWKDSNGKLIYGSTPPRLDHVLDSKNKGGKPSFVGFIKNIIYTPKEIECELVAYGVLLKQSPEGSFTDKKRSYIISQLIRSCGLTPDVSIPTECDDKISYSLSTTQTATQTTPPPTEATPTGTLESTTPTTTTTQTAPVDTNTLRTNNPEQSRGQYITAVGKPSCSYCKSLAYQNYKSTFVNYCPLCGAKGALYFTTGKGGKQDAPEGQLTCSKCDADFCIACGSEKMKPKKGTLTKVSGPTPTTEPLGATPTEAPAEGGTSSTKTVWDAIIDLCQDSACIIYPVVEGEGVRVKPLKDSPTVDYDLKMTRDFIEGTLKVDERDPLVSNSVMVVYSDKTAPKVYILDGSGAKSAEAIKKTLLTPTTREAEKKKETVSKMVAEPDFLAGLRYDDVDRTGAGFGTDYKGLITLTDKDNKLTNDEVAALAALLEAGGEYDKLPPKYKTTLQKAVAEGKLTPPETTKLKIQWGGHTYIKEGKAYTYTLQTGSGYETHNPYVVVSTEAKTPKDARKVAMKELWKMLSESGWEATMDIVHNPDITPGKWATVDFGSVYPAGKYYIESVTFKSEPTKTPTSTLTLKDIQGFAETKKEDESGMGNIDQIGAEAAKFKYERGKCSNAQCLEQTGKGDCWALSEWLYNKLTAAGITARVVEYPTGMSPRHRSVQIYQNGAWVDFPYKKYNIHPYYHATKSADSGKVVMGGA